jgi:hypothetical protein
MGRTILYFLGGVLSVVVTVMATTPSGEAATNFLSYLPTLPLLPSWVRPVVIAISVMAGSIFFGTAIIRLFSKPPQMAVPPGVALMDKYYAGEFQLVYPDDVKRKRKQERLDELSELKAPMAALRIEMESDLTGTISRESYKQKTEALMEQVASKIEAVSGKADANNYLTCGNLPRRRTQVPHQVYIDILIRDLDYLDGFINKHAH